MDEGCPWELFPYRGKETCAMLPNTYMANNITDNSDKYFTTNPKCLLPVYCNNAAIANGTRKNGKIYKSCNPKVVLTLWPKAIDKVPNNTIFPTNSHIPTKNPMYGPIKPRAKP